MKRLSKSVRGLMIRHCLNFSKAVFAVAIGIYFSLTLTGCSLIGMLGSETQNFHGNDSFELQTPKPDIVNTMSEVGKSLGYNVSSLDRGMGSISLSDQTSFFVGMLIGKISHSTLMISSFDGGKKFDINVIVIGNFGNGTQEAAEQRVNDFKARLSERLGEKFLPSTITPSPLAAMSARRIGAQQQYVAQPAVIPPRTIESAQQQYNDQSFVPGKTTVAEMQTALGSPAEIKKEANGDKTYVYLKNVYSTGVTVDVGTSYVGEYTFDSNGLFKEKNLLARPMSNPLIH